MEEHAGSLYLHSPVEPRAPAAARDISPMPMLGAVPFIRKLGDRAHFSQDEQGTRIILERVRRREAQEGGLQHPRAGNSRRGLPAFPRPPLKSRVSRF